MNPDYTLKHLTTTHDADGNETYDVNSVCPPCGANESLGKGVSGGQANRTAGKMIGEWTGKSMHGGHGDPKDKSTQPHIVISPTSGAPSKKVYTPDDVAVTKPPVK